MRNVNQNIGQDGTADGTADLREARARSVSEADSAASTGPSSISLKQIAIGTPCPVSWEGMAQGTDSDRVRFCGECRMNVYNLSAMSQLEAERFVTEREAADGRVCVRFFQRSDGRIVTADCEAIRFRWSRKVMRRLVGAAVVLLTLGSGAMIWAGTQSRNNLVQTSWLDWLFPKQPPPAAVMGDMCIVPGTPVPQPGQVPLAQKQPTQKQPVQSQPLMTQGTIDKLPDSTPGKPHQID